MMEVELRQFMESLQFVQVHMVHEKIKTHVVEVNLINLVVEFCPS